MSEKFFPELPPGLPKRKDRTNIYRLYQRFDRLSEKHGWDKHLLFEQIVILKDKTAKLVPIYCYHSPTPGDSVWLVSGVHGFKEQAGPMGIAEEIDTIAAIGKETPMIVIGLLNANYVKDKRFPDTLNGSQSNYSLCDFDHMVLDKKYSKPRPRRVSPSNPYSEILGTRLLNLLQQFPCLLLLNLHEDWSFGRTHIYSDGILGNQDPIAKRCVDILTYQGIKLRMNTHHGSKETTQNGISTMYNGSLENLFAADQIFQEGILIPGPKVPVCVAIETPTKEKHREISLHKRISAQSAIIREIPHLIHLYRENERVYQKRRVELKST